MKINYLSFNPPPLPRPFWLAALHSLTWLIKPHKYSAMYIYLVSHALRTFYCMTFQKSNFKIRLLKDCTEKRSELSHEMSISWLFASSSAVVLWWYRLVYPGYVPHTHTHLAWDHGRVWAGGYGGITAQSSLQFSDLVVQNIDLSPVHPVLDFHSVVDLSSVVYYKSATFKRNSFRWC